MEFQITTVRLVLFADPYGSTDSIDRPGLCQLECAESGVYDNHKRQDRPVRLE